MISLMYEFMAKVMKVICITSTYISTHASTLSVADPLSISIHLTHVHSHTILYQTNLAFHVPMPYATQLVSTVDLDIGVKQQAPITQ